MNSFKSGSGNLDFGDGDDDEEPDESEHPTDGETQSENQQESSTADGAEESASTPPGSDRDSLRNESRTSSVAESTEESASSDYPYFVRRNNVGDERDTRLEIHVRDKVAKQENEFRNELAERLGAGEIAKTDAREFALIAAFEHPELVAELMQEEGFGAFE